MCQRHTNAQIDVRPKTNDKRQRAFFLLYRRGEEGTDEKRRKEQNKCARV